MTGRRSLVLVLALAILLPATTATLEFAPVAFCPTNNNQGAGRVTKPFNRNGAFVKRNKNLRTKNTNMERATMCTGKHELMVPDPMAVPPNFVIWAAAGINGYTGVFYGNSATANYNFTYQYGVGCGPCPPGTPINMTLSGGSTWIQYAAGVGAFKLTGSASATVMGTVRVDPFPGSPFNVGATPATVTASPGAISATAGCTAAQSSICSSATVQPCPLSNQTIRINLTVTASRTGGATSSTASFCSLNKTIDTVCNCPATTSSSTDEAAQDPDDISSFSSPPPLFGPGVLPLTRIGADHPEALLRVGGQVLLVTALTPSDSTDLTTNGPRTQLGMFNGVAIAPHPFAGPYALVSSLVEGNDLAGPFAFTNQVMIEGLRWDPMQENFEPLITELLIVDPGGVNPLALTQPLFAPSALAFGDGAPVWGTDLLVALPEDGQIVRVDNAGNVSNLPPTIDLGSPSDIVMGPITSPFNGRLFVADVGQRAPNGALQNGTGRVLEVDGITGTAAPIITGLDCPVAVTIADGGAFGLPGPQLFVLSAGTVDPTTGSLDRSTGSLRAYPPVGPPVTLAHQLDGPSDLEVLPSGNQILIATTTELLTLGQAIPEFQLNQPGASLDVNGTQSTVFQPALTNLALDEVGQVALRTDVVPGTWDIGLQLQPPVSLAAGGLGLPDGQIVNLDLGDPSLVFVGNGFGFPPIPGLLVIPVSFPVPIGLTTQMVVLDPLSSTGLRLSQAARMVFN